MTMFGPPNRRQLARPKPRISPAYALARRIRSSKAWLHLAEQVIAEEPQCWLRLWGCTRRSTTADHIVPAAIRPDLALQRWNVHGACKNCNDRRRSRPVNQLASLRQPPNPGAQARRHIAAKRQPATALRQLFGPS